MKYRKTLIGMIMAFLMGAVLTSTPALAGGTVPTPVAPVVPGSDLPNPGPGKSITITLPATAPVAGAPAGWNPVDTVVVTGLTAAESKAIMSKGVQNGMVSTQALAATVSCNAYTAYHGMSLLWARMSQTWCYNQSYVTYWPAAACWGYSSGAMPTYAYLGCSTSQTYGLYWTQGRTRWSADLCPGYVPVWGACASHDYVNREYTYSAQGRPWQSS